MKKTKTILLVTILLTLTLLTGCGEKVVDNNGETKRKFGSFIEISHQEYYDNKSNYNKEYIVYDKDTKLVYYYVTGSQRLSITPYNIVLEDGTIAQAIYNETYK